MMSRRWLAVVLFIVFFQPVTAGAVTPVELQDSIALGQRITVIDIRNRNLYQRDHIPGAINVPAAVVSVKRLPPLGRVIVYGDGIRTDLTREALVALNQKQGINAEMLEGGFGAWQASKFQTTRKAGLSSTGVRYLTYLELQKASAVNPDMVLVDLRTKGEQPLTDLEKEFPLQSIIKLSKRQKGWDIGPCLKDSVREKLFVFIDDGDEESIRAARQLSAAEIKRVALLIGGEVGLRRKGVSEKKTVVTAKTQP